VERPAPVTYSTELLIRCLPETSVFHDKNILITGGSRGFGSLLCDGLNRLGARVWYTSRSASKDRHNIAADMSDAMSCLHMSERLLAADLNLDGVILNASPPITMNDWLEQRDIDTLSFISTTSAMALFPLRALLPRLKNKGFVIYISSEYVKKPIRHFSHYVAAKSAAEGLIRALSIEFPHQSFTIVRPPKMLTNQTNVAFDYNPPAKTEMVVGQLLSQLAKPEAIAPGLTEIDLKLPHGVS
jgi:NAD(P)-dependent dehydrogenase (short-subunit alcohol dehydrogenase family)